MSAGYIGYEQDRNISGLSAGGFWDIQEQRLLRSQNTWPPGRLVTSGLQCFLDTTNRNSYPGSGTTWFDISGNNRNFSWSAAPAYTAGTLPYFSTNGRICSGPASNSFGIDNTSGYTVSLIFLQNAAVASEALYFYSSNGTGSASRGIFSHMTWSDSNIYFDQGGCCNADTRTSVASGGVATWTMVTLQRDTNSSTRRIYKNTSLLATNTNAAANINLTTTAVGLGGSGTGASTWDARLAGFLVYSRGLSGAEISENFESLRTRFTL